MTHTSVAFCVQLYDASGPPGPYPPPSTGSSFVREATGSVHLHTHTHGTTGVLHAARGAAGTTNAIQGAPRAVNARNAFQGSCCTCMGLGMSRVVAGCWSEALVQAARVALEAHVPAPVQLSSHSAR